MLSAAVTNPKPSNPKQTIPSKPAAAHAPAHAATSGKSAGAAQAGVWKITRRAHQCNPCGRIFENGSLVFSTLSFVDSPDSETPIFERLDRCGLCHQRRERRAQEIVWRTQHEDAPKKPKLDLVSLTEVFRQLLAVTDPRLSPLRFLVSLLLLRHRRVKVVRTLTENDRDFLIMAFPRSKEQFAIEVADLPKEKLEELRAQLTAVFEGGELLPSESAAGPGPLPAAEAGVVSTEEAVPGPLAEVETPAAADLETPAAAE